MRILLVPGPFPTPAFGIFPVAKGGRRRRRWVHNDDWDGERVGRLCFPHSPRPLGAPLLDHTGSPRAGGVGGAGESASPWSATALQVRSPGFFVSLGRHPSPYLSYAPESDGDPIATGARGAPESVVDPTVSCWLPPTGRTYGPVHGRAPSLGSLSFLMEVSIHTPMGSRTRGVGAPLLVPKVPLVGLIPTCRGTGPHLHMSWHGAVLRAAVGRGAGTVSQAIPTLPKPAYKSGRRGGRSGSARPAPSTCQQQHKVCRPTSHHSFDPALSPRPRPTAPTTRHP